MKKLLAAVVGALIVFVWSFVAHVLLPLGMVGVDPLPDEAAVIEVLRDTIAEPGLYYFPGYPHPATAEQEADWQARHEAGPLGTLVYLPGGKPAMAPGQLATEFATSCLAALVLAFLLAYLTGSYPCRVALAASVGLFAWFSIQLSYWTWYGYPLDYTIAAGVMEVVGWLLAGLAMAKLVPPPAP